VSIPPPDTQVRGTVLTVVTTSDAVNGDVSSAAHLIANQGPDGISLREAVVATNNAPGVHSITFTPTLSGKTIAVGAGDAFPVLTGGSVFINGDIDADGGPDVTVTSVRPYDPNANFFLLVASSGNRLHGLVLREFSGGILLVPRSPVSTDATYSGNEVSGVVMAGTHTGGIGLYTSFGSSGNSTPTRNRWLNTRVLGNTIRTTRIAIYFALSGTAQDSIEHLTIAGNTIRTPPGGESGIGLVAGGGPGSDDNRISDVLIANNAISGYPGPAIGITSGGTGASSNTVEGVRIAGNQITEESAADASYVGRLAIGIGAGDAASDYVDPNPPIVYPEDNVVENVAVTGNTITGQSTTISFSTGCCGAADNAIRSIQVGDNTLRGKTRGPNPGIEIVGASGQGSRPTTGNSISDVGIRRNSITLTTDPGYVAPLSTPAGILLAGSAGAHGNAVSDVDVTQNCIDTDLIGLSLIGGLEHDSAPATDNSVTGITVRGNRVVRPPTRLLPVIPGLKGIDLTGGKNATSGNRVKSVVLAQNSVAGVRDDVSVFPNLGSGASGNVAEVIRDGSGTLVTPTSGVSAASTGRTVKLTYTAESGGMQNGTLTVTVPSGWSAPSTTPTAPGYATTSVGTLSVSGQTITIGSLTRAGGQTVSIAYGSKTGGGPGATAPMTTGAQPWKATQRSTIGGIPTPLIAGSPVIVVYARDGSGTLSTPSTSVAHGSTGNTIAFTYTAGAGGMSSGTLTIAVPSGWSLPSTAGAAAGYTLASSGTVSVSGQTISVSGLTRASGQTVLVTYGSKASGGPGASAPAGPAGAQTWQGKQSSVVGGALTSLIAGSPAITVG
jgi:hypothetical protein